MTFLLILCAALVVSNIVCGFVIDNIEHKNRRLRLELEKEKARAENIRHTFSKVLDEILPPECIIKDEWPEAKP